MGLKTLLAYEHCNVISGSGISTGILGQLSHWFQFCELIITTTVFVIIIRLSYFCMRWPVMIGQNTITYWYF